MNKTLRILSGVLLSLAVSMVCATANAQAPVCNKWSNQLGCDLAGTIGIPTCAQVEQSLAHENKFWRILESDTPDEACTKWAKHSTNWPGDPSKIDSYDTADGGACCYFENDGNAGFDPGSGDLFALCLEYKEIEPDFCSSAIGAFHGFHSNISPDAGYELISGTPIEFPPEPGGRFTGGPPLQYHGQPFQQNGQVVLQQTAQVRAQRQVPGTSNSFRSDLRGSAFQQLENDNGCVAKTVQGTLWYEESFSTTDPCAAEVDHIVPRRDVHGCDRGSNSYSNAQLISRRLNQWLSNDCSPHREAGRARREIIAWYLANRPVPPSGLAPDAGTQSASDDGVSVPPDSNEDSSVVTSGCSLQSTASGGGLPVPRFFLVLVLAGLIRTGSRRGENEHRV